MLKMRAQRRGLRNRRFEKLKIICFGAKKVKILPEVNLLIVPSRGEHEAGS